MDWMNRKTWTAIALILLAAAAIYAFAFQRGGDPAPAAAPAPRRKPLQTSARLATTTTPRVGTLHLEWLDGQTGSYKSERNLFSYKEPPPPPPPPPPKTTPSAARPRPRRHP